MKRIILILTLAAIALMLMGSSSDINLKIARFSTDSELPDFSVYNLTKTDVKGDYEYFLVQLNSKIMPYQRNIIENNGGQIYDYVPDNALIIRIDVQAFDNVKALDFIKHISIWQPAFRIEPGIVYNEQKPLPEENGIMHMLVTLFDKADISAFLKKMSSYDYEYSDKYVRIAADESNFRDLAIEIANMTEVYWVERDYPSQLHNAWSRWISDTYDTIGMEGLMGTWYAQLSMSSADDSTRMQLYAHALYGQNQIVGVDDTGLDWDNVYFRDESQFIYYDKDNDTVCESPNTSHRKVIAYNPYIDTLDNNSSGHGTHTSGSVAGDSLGSNIPSATSFPSGNGMAPAAKLVFFDLENTSGSFMTPFDLNLIYIWAYNGGARITSSSWGVGTGGSSSYTTRSQQLDQIAWDHKDLIMFRSAGNSNNDSPADSVNSPATAKNIVTVGATESGFGSGATFWQNPGTTSRNELIDVAEFSSHGPTREGQLKPELLAPGGWYIWSADSDGNLSTDNSGITYMGGTSMACPTAAGYAAIVRQYFTEGWYPSGTQNGGDALTPSGALIKAMMIASTRNSPGRYSTDALDNSGIKNVPSMGQGWGRITLADAIYFTGDVRDLRVYDETTGFTTAGEYNEYTIVTGPSTDEDFKVVLTYTDYPAGAAPASVVVNDLHLTVIEGANTYLGNEFGTNGYSQTGGTYDSDNVTEVVWTAPVPNSVITIRVDANTINNGPQPYALVVAGDISSTSATGILYRNSTVYDTLSTGTVVADGNLNNGETADIDVWVYNNTGSAETGVTGIVHPISSGITMLDSTLGFGDINDADSADALCRIAVSNTVSNNTFLSFLLETAYGSEIDTSYFSVKVVGTSVVSLDRDSLVIDLDIVKKSPDAKNINSSAGSKTISRDVILEPKQSDIIDLGDPAPKGVTYDTLSYETGVFDSYWYGADYWAVGFEPSKPCSLKAVWWGRYHTSIVDDTIKVYDDSGTNPGSVLHSMTARLTSTNTESYYRFTFDGPYIDNTFWVGGYASTASGVSYFGGQNGAGTWSRYYDSGWNSLSALSSNLLIRAEVRYLISIADSGMFYVINNDSTSVKDIAIDTITVKHNAGWIAEITPLEGTISQNDSLGINVYVDTVGLTADSTYIDTLMIYTDADFSKAVVLELPIILHTSSTVGVESNKDDITAIEHTLMQVVTPVTRDNATISLSLKNSADVNIGVYDISGRQIVQLNDGALNRGVYTLSWNGKDGNDSRVPSGVYFIRAMIDNEIFIGKTTLIK